LLLNQFWSYFMKVTCLPLVAFLFTGIVVAQDLLNTPEAKAACGPAGTKFKIDLVTPGPISPAPDKALIYIVQMTGFYGSCLGPCGPISNLGMDSKWIGATRSNSFLAVQATPGVHHLCAALDVHEKNIAGLVTLNLLTAEPNRIYFFALNTRYNLAPGGGSVQFSLNPINEDEGRMLVSAYSESHATLK
jgi:hypothetical protein